MNRSTVRRSVGKFALVLHTHLPWVAHHGTWPVGEEWLHQAWATSYQPLFAMARRWAGADRRDVLTLGVTPILAAQWDDPDVLRAHHTWLAHWLTRASGMAAQGDDVQRAAGRRECAAATWAMADFERYWLHGGSAALRPIVDAGVVELLGGPLTHTFTPLLPDRLAVDALRAGLVDTHLRLGSHPTGIWTPECAYAPGMETLLAQARVSHLMLDGPTMLGAGATTDAAWLLGDTDIAVVGRDLDVTYRVWSPRRGYPGDRWYRDFHSFDHEWGFRTQRVTGHRIETHEKAPYDPVRARESVVRDARDFVNVVVRKLTDLSRDDVRSDPLVVAAFDTELFGHWWHEGPQWLELVMELLPVAGVEVITMGTAARAPVGRVHPDPGSWGLHKDWHVWTDPEDMADRQESLTKDALAVLDATHPAAERSTAHDQLVRELLLTLASDWPFMVSHNSAADYARQRFTGHAEATQALISTLARGDVRAAETQAHSSHLVDHPFGWLDSRRFLHRRSVTSP